MKRFLAVFFLLASLSALVYVETEAQAQVAQLVRPFNGYVNKAVASTLSKRLTALGFAANDPIYAATMTAAQTTLQGAVAVGSVASTVAAIGTAPVWLSVALGLGAAYEIYDFTMGSNKWKADAGSSSVAVSPKSSAGATVVEIPAPSLDWSTPPAVMPYDFAAPGVGNSISYASDLPMCGTVNPTGNFPYGSPYLKGSYTVCGRSLEDLKAQAYLFYQNYMIRKLNYSTFSITSLSKSGVTSDGAVSTCPVNPLTCPQGVVYTYEDAYTGSYLDSSSGISTAVASSNRLWVFANPYYVKPNTAISLNDAAATLTNSDLSSRADPELLAAIANKIWQQAAQQPDYQGAPYDVNNPVTAQDVMNDIAAGLYPWPTVADLLTLTVASGQTAPQLDPAAQPVEQPAGQPSTTVVDLGPDPATPAPDLEAAPTGSTIVTQVMGLLPNLSAFTMPAHTSECSAPTFDFYDHTYSFQSMCDLLEEQRSLLSVIFSAVWGVSALTLVLRA